MAGSTFWLVLLIGFFGFLLGLILNHFLPLTLLRLNGTAPPRGSFGWPLLGETLSFLKPHPSNSLGAFLKHHCSRYGKVFKSHLFLSPTIVSCDQELNYFILQNEGKLFECSYPKPILGILGKSSMLVAVGDTHKRLRNVAVSLVTITKTKPEFLSDIEATAIGILHSWKDKSQVIFCEEARKFTFNVIVKQVLGLTPDEPQTTQILEDFLTFMRGLISLPLYIPGTPYARAVKKEDIFNCESNHRGKKKKCRWEH
ncbi:cytochrome P450 724B1-like [Pyrus x bretschneideri]|uniref:cytochrome P450 724B1-like n=1 Tax=Pyrus x bretschneideri TaxID=225117 RepID=UPI00202E8FC4|nr:cytochrome P450 724B1-like [Pyrus x bretschneideri]